MSKTPTTEFRITDRELIMIYRVSARGLLIENDTVLFIEYRSKDNEVYYSLPGGGQETNIDLAQTLKNEFLEEVGLEIFVGDVLLVGNL